jgi:hypothetical protein
MRQVAYAMRNLARIAIGLGNWQLARRHFQEALNCYAEKTLPWMNAVVRGELAWEAAQEENLADAERLAETGRAVCKDLDYRIGFTVVLTALGDIASSRNIIRHQQQIHTHIM